MFDVGAVQSNSNITMIEHDTAQQLAQRREALDQRPDRKRRNEHAGGVPLNYQCGCTDLMLTGSPRKSGELVGRWPNRLLVINISRHADGRRTNFRPEPFNGPRNRNARNHSARGRL